MAMLYITWIYVIFQIVHPSNAEFHCNLEECYYIENVEGYEPKYAPDLQFCDHNYTIKYRVEDGNIFQRCMQVCVCVCMCVSIFVSSSWRLPQLREHRS